MEEELLCDLGLRGSGEINKDAGGYAGREEKVDRVERKCRCATNEKQFSYNDCSGSWAIGPLPNGWAQLL